MMRFEDQKALGSALKDRRFDEVSRILRDYDIDIEIDGSKIHTQGLGLISIQDDGSYIHHSMIGSSSRMIPDDLARYIGRCIDLQ